MKKKKKEESKIQKLQSSVSFFICSVVTWLQEQYSDKR
jgi:hypothetical protein